MSAAALKPAAKSILRSLGLYEGASRGWMWAEPRLTNSVRWLTRTNQRLARQYLGSTRVPALHIGCGANHLAGWLNTELCPRGDEIFLDATRAFPLPDHAFDYVYSEHMIEHIPYPDAVRMMRECHRVLRRGGIVRIVTPDLSFLETLLVEPLPPRLQAYVEYAHAERRIDAPAPRGVYVFNHFMRAWGHQFIYNHQVLADLLASAGFAEITRHELNDSPHDALRGLAKTDRMPPGFLAMESMTLEARKRS